MAALSTQNPTLADWAKELDPDGTTPDIVAMLSQTNEILLDAVFTEGNLPTGHRVTVDTSLPTVGKRQINEGTVPTKGTSAQIDEAFSIFEAWSEIDAALVGLNGNDAGYRLNQSRRFLESMNQTVSQSLMYGNPGTDPADFLGLSNRYNTPTSAGNGANVFDALGASGDNTSVWLVVWGPGSVSMGFPKGSMAGLDHVDKGIQTVTDFGGTAGAKLDCYVDKYTWTTGLIVEDWRSICRIGSIDVSDLLGLTGTQALTAYTSNLLHLMEQALYRPVNLGGRPAFYMNRTAHAGLSKMAMEKNSAAVKIETGMSQFGTPMSWTSFMGVPCRKVDRILNSETAI